MNSIYSVHMFRRTARKRERELQAWLDNGRIGIPPGGVADVTAKGAHVEKAGIFQWAVVTTDYKGH